MLHICFVCLGNICRSPTAEGVMQYLLDQKNLNDKIKLDSAGTSSYHVGEAADRRSRAAASKRGFSLQSRSRQFTTHDFARFDYIIAMDSSNLRKLLQLAPTPVDQKKCFLLRNFDPNSPENSDVPDPYYGGTHGFERVLDICTAGCIGLLQHIQEQKHI